MVVEVIDPALADVDYCGNGGVVEQQRPADKHLVPRLDRAIPGLKVGPRVVNDVDVVAHQITQTPYLILVAVAAAAALARVPHLNRFAVELKDGLQRSLELPLVAIVVTVVVPCSDGRPDHTNHEFFFFG